MKYRKLGNTGLKVSEVAFGAEWLQGKSLEESKELLDYCHSEGVNFLDCWMSEPNVRTNIGYKGGLDHSRPFRFYMARWPICPYT